MQMKTFENKYKRKKNVTLSIDEEIYNKYKEYCRYNAISLSRSVEIFMSTRVQENE